MELAVERAQAAWRGLAALLAVGAPALAQTTIAIDVNSAGATGDQEALNPAVSATGRYVAFDSASTNLVPGHTGTLRDVFVRDVATGVTTLVSVGPGGVQADGASTLASISADGRFVAYQSSATNLVPGDTNGVVDVFVHDRSTGSTERISVGPAGAQANVTAARPALSADGRWVAFDSAANNMIEVDTNGAPDVFVHDRATGLNVRVSVSSTGREAAGASTFASISADGACVSFVSAAADLVPDDANFRADVFVHELATGATTRVSVSSQGAEANQSSSLNAVAPISGDGRRVAFFSDANNLVPGDTNATTDVFVHDRLTGTTTRVSVGPGGVQGNGPSPFSGVAPALSSDGDRVAFRSLATNLVPVPPPGPGVYVHALSSSTTWLASVDPLGAPLGCNNRWCAISGDGRRVVFNSLAQADVPGGPCVNSFYHLYLREPGPGSASCFGDGSGAPCPCANGAIGRGCQNSAATGGAVLTALGAASLANDTLVLTASRELPNALGLFVQGDASSAPANFGDGQRCVGGYQRRLYATQAVGGGASVPPPGGLAISARSAALADPLAPGATRHYQAFYRDANPLFCPEPQGGAFNSSNAVSITWSL